MGKSWKARAEEFLSVFLLGATVVGFSAGWVSVKAVQEARQLELVAKDGYVLLQNLDRDYVAHAKFDELNDLYERMRDHSGMLDSQIRRMTEQAYDATPSDGWIETKLNRLLIAHDLDVDDGSRGNGGSTKGTMAPAGLAVGTVWTGTAIAPGNLEDAGVVDAVLEIRERARNAVSGILRLGELRQPFVGRTEGPRLVFTTSAANGGGPDSPATWIVYEGLVNGSDAFGVWTGPDGNEGTFTLQRSPM